ncbi:MAG TPA: UDP-N-acetylglucosamine 2-epimerase [Candidatus Limnocylindrales bacterium]|nr:UDP-N-acetylglucosamine 2-epimerase [Candidatus Limnocylindrales bacterium]
MSSRILFLIPARGGSQRVPRKNLRTVGGVPLVARAVRLARAAAAALGGGAHRVVCSTDDAEIAAVARAWGAQVLDRPGELATATATSVDVALHALDVAGRASPGSAPDVVVLLQPTSPLTEPADVVGAIERFEASGRRSVVSVTPSHPASWHVRGGTASGEPFVRLGDADADRLLTGAIYVVDAGRLRATRTFVDEDSVAFEIPAERSVDIDEPADLVIAEAFAAAADDRARDVAASREPAPGERRRIAVLTTGRQDWGILHSTAAAIRAHPDLELVLLAGGMHLSPRHGATVEEIRRDGFEPHELLEWLAAADASTEDPPADRQASTALAAVGAALRRTNPDALVLAGDRFETAAAALAATVDRVPIVHLHGGEQTLGAFDDALRHAISKLAHLHLVSHEEHAARLVAMGEDPATIHVVGTPGLDALHRPDLPDRAELERDLGISLDPPLVVVTVHPATLDADPTADAAAVAAAIDRVAATYVITLPNVDPGAAGVLAALEAAADAPGRIAVRALGERRYWGLLRVADAMLGNSSSAIAEAPAIGLPAVNVGDRQAGRRRSPNVIDVPADAEAVARALRHALDPAFREGLLASPSPGSDGRVGERIAHIISTWHPTRPPRKASIDVTG